MEENIKYPKLKIKITQSIYDQWEIASIVDIRNDNFSKCMRGYPGHNFNEEQKTAIAQALECEVDEIF
jgi:hypothetical protein